jgi:tetratricopeptide (TPR) repeat protein
VSLVDVAPTLLAQVGLPPLPGLDGRDLAGPRDPRRDLYAETLAPLLDHGWSALRAVRRGGIKLVDGSQPELFDLVHDPKEGHDLWPGTEGPALRDTLRRYAASLGQLPPAAASLDVDAREALASLGYATGSSAIPRDLGGEGRPHPRARMGVQRELDAISGLEAPREARARLEALAVKESGSNLVQRRLAAIRMRVEDYEGAATAYREAGRLGYAGDDLAGALAAACRRAGEARAEHGDLAGARRWLEDAERAQPGRADVAHALGVVEARADRAAEALAHFERANRLDASLGAAWFSKGLLLERLGREDAAKSAYARFLALPSSAAAERAHASQYIAVRR